MALTIALCDACPSSEVDEMTISLLNIFDSRGLGFVLLEALIEHEVEETGERNFSTQMFVYANCH
jgi:neurofibromin 1